MTTPVALPATLRGKLAALARRIRLLRLLRGASWLLLLLAVSFAGLYLADCWLDLPEEALSAALAVLTGLGALLLVFGIVLPLCRRLPPEALAALIEKQHPELGERLTSSVELAATPETGHGSRALIALLLLETEDRTRSLDFRRAFSARPAAVLATVAACALLLALLPALVRAEDYADFGDRLLSAWFAPGRFTLHVSPGDQVVATGQTVTVAVRVERRKERSWPTAVYLVCTDADGKASRLRLQAAGPGAFVCTFDRVVSSLTYHAECGRAVSEEYCITAVEPVALAPGSPACTITPPSYVNPAVHPKETLQNFTDLSVLQYSRARLDLRFNRPAQSARLEIAARPAPGKPAARTWTVPVYLSVGREQAFVELPALDVGAYALKLHMEAEHQIASVQELAALTVWGDGPPVFTERPRLAGAVTTAIVQDGAATPGPRGERLQQEAAAAKEAAPGDVLRLKVGVEDKVGVDRAQVEYRINGADAHFETIFEAKGARSAATEHPFQLTAKVKDGDVLCYRIRAADNRRLAAGACTGAYGQPVPAGALGPHVIYHPEKVGGQDRWFVLPISARAESLQKQEILAQRESVGARLEAIRKKLRGERDQLQKLRDTAQKQPSLAPAQAGELRAVRRAHRGARDNLVDLARETAETPGLQTVAERAHDVAEGELARGEEALHRAQDDKAGAPARGEQMQKADRELASALEKLDELQRFNEQLASDRLDQVRMEQLARQEEELSKQAGDLAGKKPEDPKRQPALARVRAEQDRVAAELERLAEQSKLFRSAVASAQADQARQMAKQAERLAQEQRALAHADAQRRQEHTRAVLGKFAHKQEQLAERAAELARQTQPLTAAARARPLQPQDARRAAEALQQGQAGEALRLQEQTAGELERVAGDLDRAADLERDPREAVRRLAQQQEKLENRLNDAAARVASSTPQQLLQAVNEIQRSQEAIGRAAEALPVPPTRGEAVRAQQGAVERAARAAAALQQRDPLRAYDEMQLARQALAGLALRMPSLEERREQLAALKELARQQRELARQASADPKAQRPEQTAEQLATLARQAAARQADLAQRLERITPPPAAAAAHGKALREMTAARQALAQAQAPAQARGSLTRAADAAEELARQAAGEQQAGQKPGAVPAGEQAARAQAGQARDLAQAQKDLREALRQALSTPPAGDAARQQARETRQQELQQQAGELMKKLTGLAQAAAPSPQAQQAAAQAANLTGEAQAAMQQARTEGTPAQERAAQKLQGAAEQAGRAAEQMAAKGAGAAAAAGQKAGEAVARGQQQIAEAQANLGRNQPQAAQAAMQQAAAALQQASAQAAQQLAQQSGPPGKPMADNKGPGSMGASGGGPPDAKGLARDLQKYTGRPWGQLPGELQTRILQDMRARYGEDYAAIIQRYFEEIADTQRKD